MLLASLPPLVPSIARAFRSSTRGVVTCRYHRVLTVSAGPSGQRQEFLFDGVWLNGTLTKVRMLRYTIDGRAASASQIVGIVRSYEHPRPGDVFDAPWDPRFMSQYRDRVVSSSTIVFTAVDRSYGHGDGTLTHDARDDVLSYTYAPTILPAHTTAGTVHGQRAQVLPGYWAMTSESQTYIGHYAIFGAHATVAITESSFRRYPSLRAADAAIASDRL